jgi:imidazolonepropionase-like amidohydrolase
MGLVLAMGMSATAAWTQVLQSGEGWAEPPTGKVVIRAARMFDANAGVMLENQVVLVERDRIVAVGSDVRVPPDATVIDLGNATLMPGFIDSHLHIMPRGDQSLPYRTLTGLQQAQNDALAGFTTIVDMSGRNTLSPIDIRNAINRGVAWGPRMQVAGHEITQRDRNAGPTSSVVSGDPFPNEFFIAGPWMARHMVRKLKHYGADWIKIYNGQDFIGDEHQHFYPDGTMLGIPAMTMEELEAIIDEAHRRGMKVSCHAYGGPGLPDCINAGVDKIEHGNELTDELARTMAQNGQTMSYTLQNMLGTDEDDLPRTGGKVSRLSLTKQSIPIAMRNGVNIAFASDMNPPRHGEQVTQFAHYVEFGMTPAQALQIAMMNAAKALNYGWDDRVGSLEVGKYADVIATAGNPLEDITETERVKFVMKGGVVLKNELTETPSGVMTSGSR